MSGHREGSGSSSSYQAFRRVEVGESATCAESAVERGRGWASAAMGNMSDPPASLSLSLSYISIFSRILNFIGSQYREVNTGEMWSRLPSLS